jgi:hypothetical protein
MKLEALPKYAHTLQVGRYCFETLRLTCQTTTVGKES